MSLDLILAALDAKPSGARWMAKCPAHGDKSPSLMISERGDGGVRLHCFAGCSQPDIMAALGLDEKLAWKPRQNITNAQWAQKNAYITKLVKAISRDAYHIKMLKQDFDSGRMSGTAVIMQLKRLAPSVFFPSPRLDKDAKKLQADACRAWWALAIEVAPTTAGLAELLGISFTVRREMY